LDDQSELLGLSLRDVMMTIRHPTNKKFTLFHTIDKHFREKCHVLTVLKLAESLAHAMIAAMLPYLLWQHAQSQPGSKASNIKKWFKPAARRRAEDAFWCPKDECVKNQSNLMLDAALDNEDGLYWETEATKPPSPKRKRNQAEEESLDDSISTVKTAMSAKKTPKSALKGSPSATNRSKTQTRFQNDSQTVTSQNTTISQLTEMVSAVQQENKTILSRFDQLAEQIATLMSHNTSNSTRPAGGQESGRQP